MGTALLPFRIKMRMIFEKFISFKFIYIPTFVDT